MSEETHKRRWCQFSLMTLLVVVTVFCMTVGWVGSRMHRARVNRDRVAAVEDAVAAIRELAWVRSDYEEGRPQTWLEKQFGDPGGVDDPVGVLKVSSVMFWNASDTDVEHLKGLNSLQSVDLNKTEITDAGLEHLKGLKRLETLFLHGTNITNAGLEHLNGLTNIKLLDLNSTNVSDAGLVHLKELTKLET